MKKFKLSSHVPVIIQGCRSTTHNLLIGTRDAIKDDVGNKRFKAVDYTVVCLVYKLIFDRRKLQVNQLMNIVKNDIMKEKN
jgi:hypothetical protein